MRVNEEEISDVSDVSFLNLKQKNKNKKRSLKAILEDVSFCGSYEPVQVHERWLRNVRNFAIVWCINCRIPKCSPNHIWGGGVPIVTKGVYAYLGKSGLREFPLQ